MASPRPSRILAVSCGAHFVHDGFTDIIYLLLPVWQGEFGLTLAAAGLLKTLFSGGMASLQVPAGLLAERVGERRLLAFGTLVAAGGYFIAGWSTGFAMLAACLLLAGAGTSVQHPLSSSLVSRAFAGGSLRTALGTYNFAGDIGKVVVPFAAAAMIALWHWRSAVLVLAVGGAVAALAILVLLPREPRAAAAAEAKSGKSVESGGGFAALCVIGMIDATTRTGFLTFLPFLLAAKGASVTLIGTALSLVFAGGAAGKFVCGATARRVGVLRTVILTEAATAAGIVLLLPLGLTQGYWLLPLIGVALNGTSSVLYGTVAELAAPEWRARAFGVFYSVTLGAGALAPVAYGAFSDRLGVPAILAVIACVVLLVVPLTLPLRRPLALLAQA